MFFKLCFLSFLVSSVVESKSSASSSETSIKPDNPAYNITVELATKYFNKVSDFANVYVPQKINRITFLKNSKNGNDYTIDITYIRTKCLKPYNIIKKCRHSKRRHHEVIRCDNLREAAKCWVVPFERKYRKH
uniref:Cystatin domain-containing protein n=1 Tax=Panagrellus redivivus TaxID=6233 RepID=A0A7E4WBV6_PANRE